MIGSYAGANCFLDALAHHRAVQGQPALVVNWGVWSEVGRPRRSARSIDAPLSGARP